MANFERVLADAVSGGVDAVVHGGDLFFRSRVPPSLVQMAFRPLKRVADAGIPVYLVPGNHERSRIPYPMLALHPGIHIFDRPRTFAARLGGSLVALAGFPYHRKDVRRAFPAILERTGWRDVTSDVNLLCVHHCFEGATVGPANYVFRSNSDVVRSGDVPAAFAAVLTGHVHRHQALVADLAGRPISCPILYPGSIERTSFAEVGEAKGYLVVDVKGSDRPGGTLANWEFRELPARPMVVEDVRADGSSEAHLASVVRRAIGRVPDDAVLRLRVHGTVAESARAVLRAAPLRSMAPPTMNVDVVLVDERRRQRLTARSGGG